MNNELIGELKGVLEDNSFNVIVQIAESGPRGLPGADGITPHIGVNGNWYLGETDTGVKAEGKDGKDGYTPVRGTDYWTTADQAAIVDDVLAAVDELILGGAS
jgi:hypothetical protein